MWSVGQDVDLTSRDLNNSTGMNGMSSTASTAESSTPIKRTNSPYTSLWWACHRKSANARRSNSFSVGPRQVDHPSPQHVSDRFHPAPLLPKFLVRRHACSSVWLHASMFGLL